MILIVFWVVLALGPGFLWGWRAQQTLPRIKRVSDATSSDIRHMLVLGFIAAFFIAWAGTIFAVQLHPDERSVWPAAALLGAMLQTAVMALGLLAMQYSKSVWKLVQRLSVAGHLK